MKWPARASRTYCGDICRAAFNRKKNAPLTETADALRAARKAERRGEAPEGLTLVLEMPDTLLDQAQKLVGRVEDLRETARLIAKVRAAGDSEAEAEMVNIYLGELASIKDRAAMIVEGTELAGDAVLDVLIVGEAGNTELDTMLNLAGVVCSGDDDDDDETEAYDA